jgi:hypothetical protein
MLGNMVNFGDYEGVQGFGSTSAAELNDLFKALQAGQATERPSSVTPGDGYTLKPESLDRNLKNITYDEASVVFWRKCDKSPAYNTVEEFSQLREYGNGVAAFIEEGELPSEDDATYSREFDVIKYMGTTRRVTHVMQTVRSHIGNVIAQETINGTRWLLRQVEKAMFYGDSALVPQEFDGLFTQLANKLPAESVFDMRGKPLSQDAMEEAAHVIRAVPNYGMPTDVYMADGAYSDLARSFYPTQRSSLPTPNAPDGMVGFQVAGMRTQAGPIRFNPDIFIEPGRAPVAAGLGDVSKRPGVPSLGAGAAGALGGGEVSQFAAADAGDYRYKVAARNRFGISAPVDINAGAGITVAAGQKVTFTIDQGVPSATSYVIYRTKVDGAAGTETEIKQVPATAGTVTFSDFNDDLPETTQAALVQGNRANMVIKQLAPFTRIPLATIDTSVRWSQVLYLVLTLHSPRKNVLFKNVGRAEGTKSPSL